MAADPITTRTVDDILAETNDFDFDDDHFTDPLAQGLVRERDDKSTLSPRKRKAEDDPFGRSNIDEEIKITKQRKKIPKLDADRLLSGSGIPKIRGLLRDGQFKKKLRLKGKGHEFSDAAKLLNHYQMWLDNLYPRAKFADALQLVEKAGHTKKMQMYRKSWMDEGKPGYIRREVLEAVNQQDEAASDTREDQSPVSRNTAEEEEEHHASMFFGGGEDSNADNAADPDDDELDALLAQEDHSAPVPNRKSAVQDESEGEDDLDALLAEQDARSRPSRQIAEGDIKALHDAEKNFKSAKTQSPPASGPGEEADDTADLEALPNQDPTTSKSPPQRTAPNNKPKTFDDASSDDNPDDLDALLNIEQTSAPEPELPQMTTSGSASPPTHKSRPIGTGIPGSEEVPELDNAVSSSPIPNIGTDELDELLDEHDKSVAQRKKHDEELVEGFLSSSPIPNREGQ